MNVELPSSETPLPAVRAFRADRVPTPRQGGVFTWPAERPWVDLELGCGVGLHPIQYGQKNPQRHLIAIEHTAAKFESFQRRLAHHPQVRNVTAIHADAVEWVTHCVPPSSVSRCFILYPNPWPRKGDERRRWYAQPFFGRLLKSLRAGGEVMLTTNDERYAERATLFFRDVWGLADVTLRSFDEATQPSPRTHFEKKYLERGQVCYEVQAKRK